MDWSGWVNPETPKARAAGLMHRLQSLTIGTDEDTTPNPLTEHRSFLAQPDHAAAWGQHSTLLDATTTALPPGRRVVALGEVDGCRTLPTPTGAAPPPGSAVPETVSMRM